MYRTLFGLLAVFAIALAFVGITFSSSETEGRADYAFVNGAEPQSLDPHKMKGQPEGRIGDALFEGLTYKDAKSFEPVPGCADSWTVSPDGRTWTFHIRESAKWSNGDPVTAHDFAWSWRRLQEPETASEYSQVLHVVRHARALNQYAAQVVSLRGDPNSIDEDARRGVVGRWADVVSKHGSAVPFSAWSEFVRGTGLRDVVKGTAEAALLGPLGRNAGDLTAEESSGVGKALAAEADRRERENAEAKAHFGIDQGAFAKDDHTFVVELEVLAPYFKELTAFYVTYPVHRQTIERWKEEWFLPGRIVSNGPFRLQLWRVNEKMRLEKNPYYWGAPSVHLETVDVYPHDNRSTALNLYLRDDVDWIPVYPLDLVDTLKKRPDYYSNPGMIVYFYRLNVTREPFNDVRVRKALAKTIDRERIVRDITKKGEATTTTVVAPGVPDYTSPENDLAFDPEGAKRLLAEAGYGPGGKTMRRFTIVHNTDEGHKTIAEFVADGWKRHLGIDVEVKNKEWQALLADVNKLEYDVERAGWIGDYRDPNTFLDMFITGDGNNETGWGDPFYDRLIALAARAGSLKTASSAEVDELLKKCRERERTEKAIERLRGARTDEETLAATLALRGQLFREAEALLLRDGVPVIPFYFYMVSGMVKPDVLGFYSFGEHDGKRVPNLQDDHPFREVTTARSRARAR